MRRLILFILLALVLVTPASASKPMIYSIQPLAWRGDDGSIRNHCTTWAHSIKVENQVFISWVTAAHCIRRPDGEPDLEREYYIAGLRAYPHAWNPELDIAELWGREDVVGLEVETDPRTIKVGTPVKAEGHPWGWPERFYAEGYVSVTDWHGFSVYMLNAAPGNSGSPVMNKKGRVVGMVQVGFCSNLYDYPTFCNVMGGSSLEQLLFYFQIPSKS